MELRYSGHKFIISVTNPADKQPAPKKYGARFVSTKEGAGHGLGTESVMAAIDRYAGHMECSVADEIVRIDLLLNNIKAPLSKTRRPPCRRLWYW